MGQLDAMAWADATGIKDAALNKARSLGLKLELGSGGGGNGGGGAMGKEAARAAAAAARPFEVLQGR